MSGTATSVIKVMLVDDHDMLRSSMRIAFEEYSEVDIVGEASSGAEALAMAGELKPDVVLMDILMPGMDGLAATRLIRQANPKIQVVILTSFEDEKFQRSAHSADVSDYLLKNVSIDELVDAIRRAYDRGRET